MSDEEFVVVGRFQNRIDAELARSALQAADINSVVSADDAGGVMVPPIPWIRGVRLLVRAKDMERATKIIGSSE